ncbi:hypothetical protein MLD38_013554 [Melastoma candidum]|uniref:Uncharacterized protein n=1 Tax=Melastoma candidum TaxID=119954 RepID=A0ACB9RB94_9MYRT|nr:hypothetical protein MLD38_013554 [Melastoma candidum]
MTNKDKKKAMETINDLVEEAKLRTVLWSFLVFSVTYFFSPLASDPRLVADPPQPSPYLRWKRTIDSPVVKSAIADFVDKILKDFVVDLWYADITQNKEFPEQIHSVIMDALGEISLRVKEINLVDLLTRDIVDLIGDHLDVYRRILGVI